MAANGYRVTLGTDPKLYPATEDKKAFATVRLVEQNWSRDADTGKFVEAEPSWYDGNFYGRNAELLAAGFEKGDALLALGRTEQVTRQGKDGVGPPPLSGPSSM